jgi:hypothetical protein
MKWSRTKDELKAKVITSKINNPDKTIREITQETWLPKSTIADIINKDIPEVRNSSETIANLIDVNNRILNITWELLLTKLENWEKVRIDEVIKSRDLALKQNKLVEVIDNKEWEFIVKFEI